jgi:hypothetical protein
VRVTISPPSHLPLAPGTTVEVPLKHYSAEHAGVVSAMMVYVLLPPLYGGVLARAAAAPRRAAVEMTAAWAVEADSVRVLRD